MKAQQMDKYYAEILKVAREKAGLTQEELAMRAGLNQNRISRMERGISRLNLTDYVKAMSVLSYDKIKGMLPGEPGLEDILCQLLNFHYTQLQYSGNEIKFTDLFGPLVAYHEGNEGEVLYLPAKQPPWYALGNDLNTIQEKSQSNPEATGRPPGDIGQLPLPLRVWSEVSVNRPTGENRPNLRS